MIQPSPPPQPQSQPQPVTIPTPIPGVGTPLPNFEDPKIRKLAKLPQIYTPPRATINSKYNEKDLQDVLSVTSLVPLDHNPLVLESPKHATELDLEKLTHPTLQKTDRFYRNQKSHKKAPSSPPRTSPPPPIHPISISTAPVKPTISPEEAAELNSSSTSSSPAVLAPTPPSTTPSSPFISNNLNTTSTPSPTQSQSQSPIVIIDDKSDVTPNNLFKFKSIIEIIPNFLYYGDIAIIDQYLSSYPKANSQNLQTYSFHIHTKDTPKWSRCRWIFDWGDENYFETHKEFAELVTSLNSSRFDSVYKMSQGTSIFQKRKNAHRKAVSVSNEEAMAFMSSDISNNIYSPRSKHQLYNDSNNNNYNNTINNNNSNNSPTQSNGNVSNHLLYQYVYHSGTGKQHLEDKYSQFLDIAKTAEKSRSPILLTYSSRSIIAICLYLLKERKWSICKSILYLQKCVYKELKIRISSPTYINDFIHTANMLLANDGGVKKHWNNSNYYIRDGPDYDWLAHFVHKKAISFNISSLRKLLKHERSHLPFKFPSVPIQSFILYKFRMEENFKDSIANFYQYNSQKVTAAKEIERFWKALKKANFFKVAELLKSNPDLAFERLDEIFPISFINSSKLNTIQQPAFKPVRILNTHSSQLKNTPGNGSRTSSGDGSGNNNTNNGNKNGSTDSPKRKGRHRRSSSVPLSSVPVIGVINDPMWYCYQSIDSVIDKCPGTDVFISTDLIIDNTPLQYAIDQSLPFSSSSHGLEVFDLLAKKHTVNLMNIYGKTALHELFFSRIKDKSSLRITSRYHLTPSSKRSTSNPSITNVENKDIDYVLDIAKLLINHGANVNQNTYYDGKTPLHYFTLCNFTSTDLLNMLTTTENINSTDDHGDTPLHFAARNRNRLVICQLQDKGADPNIADFSGITPINLIRDDPQLVQLLTTSAIGSGMYFHSINCYFLNFF